MRQGVGAITAAAYRFDNSESAWLEGIARAVMPHLDRGHGMYVRSYDASNPASFRTERLQFYGCAQRFESAAEQWLQAPPSAVVRDTFLAHPCGTLSEALGERLTSTLLAPVHSTGVVDVFALNAVDTNGVGYALVAPMPAGVVVSSRERVLWSRMTAHIARAHRLRCAFGLRGGHVPTSVLDGLPAEGRRRSANEKCLARLRQLAIRVDSSQQHGDAIEALDVWNAVLEGRWSLIDRFDSNGRHFLIAHENGIDVPPEPHLTSRERQAIAFAALGHCNKLIAYQLGLDALTVGSHLSRAAAKLLVRNRAELIRTVQAMRHRDTRAYSVAMGSQHLAVVTTPGIPKQLAGLTPIESEIVHGALQGLSNTAIAERRGTSKHTIANQLRTIYRKLGVGSRSELVGSFSMK